jgi:hypothetical protein
MPGSFETSPTEDGAQTSCAARNRNGIFARNDSTDTAAEPGGNGVFGLTVAPGGTGVFGANNAPAGSRGRGVQGNGPEAAFWLRATVATD